jgi:hypothetical protein
MAAALGFVGCRKDEEIKVYRVAKGESASAMPANPRAGMKDPGPDHTAPRSSRNPAPPPSATRKPVGLVPPGWQAGGGSSMRRASFRVFGKGAELADISLIILSGPAGGAVNNINRWRAQLGLEPLEPKDLEKEIELLSTKCGQAMVVDLSGKPTGADPATDGRTVAAIVERPGETWFFKMRGNAELAGKEKQRFLDWVASVEPGEVESR